MKSCVVDKYGQEVDVAMVGLLIDKAKNALGSYFKYNNKLHHLGADLGCHRSRF